MLGKKVRRLESTESVLNPYAHGGVSEGSLYGGTCVCPRQCSPHPSKAGARTYG